VDGGRKSSVFVTPLPPALGLPAVLHRTYALRLPMKVTHVDDEHLLCLSSEEVALLVDLCHAAAFSDELAAGEDTRRRLQRFMADVQASLFDSAQDVWQRQRPAAHP